MLIHYSPSSGASRATRTSGFALRNYRGYADMTRKELSHLSGVAENVLMKLEQDELVLQPEMARILARVLCCHPGVLLFADWTE